MGLSKKTTTRFKRIGLVLIIVAVVILVTDEAMGTIYYHVSSEELVKGTLYGDYSLTYSLDQIYEVLTEEDEGDKDIDRTPTQEYIVSGTSEFGTFSACILTKSDSVYCSYHEYNDGAQDKWIFLLPEGIGTYSQWLANPAVPNWQNMDDDPPHDGDGSYGFTTGNAIVDTYIMEDISSLPSGYDLEGNLFIFAWAKTVNTIGSGQGLQNRVRTYATDYDDTAELFLVQHVYQNITREWVTNPNTGSDWTLGEINAMEVGMVSLNPVALTTRATSVGGVVPLRATDYILDVQYNFTTLPASAEYYNLTVTAMRDMDTENVNIQVYDFDAVGWNTRATINTDSFADYTYALTSDEVSGQTARIRFTDAGGDITQTNLSVDWVNMRADYLNYTGILVQKIIDMEKGNYTFRVNGYATGDTWNIQFYNWQSAGYSTVLSGAFATTPGTRQLDVERQYLSETVKGDLWIRFTDNNPTGGTQGVLYLDLVEVFVEPAGRFLMIQSDFVYHYDVNTGVVHLWGREKSYVPYGVQYREWWVDGNKIATTQNASFMTPDPMLRPFTSEVHNISYVVVDATGLSMSTKAVTCHGNPMLLLIVMTVIIGALVLIYIVQEKRKEGGGDKKRKDKKVRTKKKRKKDLNDSYF